jgi:hypothetical protein
MAHFAQIENGSVINVLVVEKDLIDSGALGDPSVWIQVSYNTKGGVHYGPDGLPDGGVALRKNFPGKGYVYDAGRDAFYLPQPHSKWILNEDTCSWQPPVPRPTDGEIYAWNDELEQWDHIPYNGNIPTTII